MLFWIPLEFGNERQMTQQRARHLWTSRMLILLVLVLQAGCGRAPAPSPAASAQPASASGFPLTIRDDLGRTVVVASEPRRIVALLPSHTETLFALGVGDRVIGVDDNSDHPPAAAQLPRLGALYEAHIEQIIALSPDLVLASEGGPAPERLAGLGLTVWAGSASGLEDVYRVVTAIGRLTGREAEAAALSSRMRADVLAVETELAGAARVRVYDELDPTPYTIGPGSFVGALLAKAGGDNIVPAGLGDFPRISPELILARDPEVILGVSREEAARRPGWAGVTAVRRGAVSVLTPAEQSVVSRPGPRLAEGIRVLARHLHATSAP
jgi:iron complex transport system substrate-binding protein